MTNRPYFLLAGLLATASSLAQTPPPPLTGSLKKVRDQFTFTPGFRFTHVLETRKAGQWTAVTYAGEAANQGGARFTIKGAGADDGTWLLVTPSYGKFVTYRQVGAGWKEQASPVALHMKEVVLLTGLPNYGTVQKLPPETVDGRATAHYRITDAPNISDLYVDEAKGQLVSYTSSQPTANYRYRTVYHQLGLTPKLPSPR